MDEIFTWGGERVCGVLVFKGGGKWIFGSCLFGLEVFHPC